MRAVQARVTCKAFVFAACVSLVALAAVGTSEARAEELEPETGTFAGFGPPDPYELLVRRALFEDDTYRE